MTADTAHADAFAAGRREATAAVRAEVRAMLNLPPETPWEEVRIVLAMCRPLTVRSEEPLPETLGDLDLDLVTGEPR